MTVSRENLTNIGLLIVLIGGAFLAKSTGHAFMVTMATKAAIFALAAVGLNLALGYGGMVSFGHAAFFGIGGYVCGILASHGMSGQPVFAGLPGTNAMLVIWPAAMLVSALVALLIGAMSLRTRGVYFIMVTLAFAQMVYYFAISWPKYGGEDGLSFYVRNKLGTINTMVPMNYFLICTALLVLALIVTAIITRARFGLALKSVRANPQRALAVGIRPFAVRLTAFVISGAITGLAGALYADLNRFVGPGMLSWHMSGEIMVFVILGGVGRLMGPVAGAMLFILLEHILGGWTEYWQAPLGVLLLLIVLFAPGGLIGLIAGKERHHD